MSETVRAIGECKFTLCSTRSKMPAVVSFMSSELHDPTFHNVRVTIFFSAVHKSCSTNCLWLWNCEMLGRVLSERRVCLWQTTNDCDHNKYKQAASTANAPNPPYSSSFLSSPSLHPLCECVSSRIVVHKWSLHFAALYLYIHSPG